MTNREQFKIAMIEAIRGLLYEEAIEAYIVRGASRKEAIRILQLNITIGRVMQALGTLYAVDGLGNFYHWDNLKGNYYPLECKWKNMSNGTDDDQIDETIDKLLKLRND